MNNLDNIKKEAMLKIFPGISEDSPCSIRPYSTNRLGLYYNETCIASLSEDMKKEYEEYIKGKNE